MGRRQQQSDRPQRSLLARPLDTLAFLLPLLVFYEVASLTRPRDRVIAFDLMRQFLELFGHAGVWAPGLAVVAILIATQMVSGKKWSISWGRAGWMYVESVVLAFPLLSLNWWTALTSAAAPPPPGLLNRIAMGVGAGVYEELVFRLVLICLVMIIGVDMLRLSRLSVGLVAILLSALAFSAHHYQPIGAEPFALASFTFRAIAGGYLAIIFWYRGYGPAAGCHAAYNVTLALMSVAAE